MNRDQSNSLKFLSLEDWILLGFCIALAGAFILPLFPFWKALFRLTALALLAVCWNKKGISSNKTAWILFLFSIPLIFFSIDLFSEIFHRPVPLIASWAKAVYGNPRGLVYELAILIFDAFLTIGLLPLAWQNKNVLFFRIKQGMLVSLIFFWAWSHTSLLISGVEFLLSTPLQENQLNTLRSQASGLEALNIWTLVFLISVILIRTGVDKTLVQRIIMGAVFFQAFLVIVQYGLGDFSYVVEHPDFTNYFFRTRGTHFYHGAVDLFMALGLFFILASGIDERGNEQWKTYAGIILLVVAIYINNTRAISLGMMGGAAVALAIQWLRKNRNPKYLVAYLSIVLIFGSSIFYFKPSPVVKKTSTVKVENYVQANSPRLLLLSTGFSTFMEHPVKGQGVGATNIPLDGKYFRGEPWTYSSHSLFLDLALGTGFPGALAFLLLLGLALLGAWKLKTRVPNPQIITNDSGRWIGFFVLFLLTGIFFPQEQNYTILLIILACAFILIPVENLTEPKGSLLTLTRKTLNAFIGLGVVFAFLISAYVFPIAELFTRHLQKPELVKLDSIHTNSTPQKYFLKILFSVIGRSSIPISQLKDDFETWPISEGWIIWHPGSDIKYPNIRRQLGYSQLVGGHRSVSFNLPLRYQVIPSKQTAVHLIRIGCWPLTSNLKNIPGAHPENRDSTDQEELSGNHSEKYLPNLASFSYTPQKDQRNDPRVYATDKRVRTAWISEQSEPISILFDTHGQLDAPVTLYRLVGIYHRDYTGVMPDTVVVEGSHDKNHWEKLAREAQVKFPENQIAYIQFSVKNKTAYRYYRFQFSNQAEKNFSQLGLSEIELYAQDDSCLN